MQVNCCCSGAGPWMWRVPAGEAKASEVPQDLPHQQSWYEPPACTSAAPSQLAERTLGAVLNICGILVRLCRLLLRAAPQVSAISIWSESAPPTTKRLGSLHVCPLRQVNFWLGMGPRRRKLPKSTANCSEMAQSPLCRTAHQQSLY